MMHQLANPTSAVAGGARPALPPAALNYLLTIVKVMKGTNLSGREQRELETLATALDLLAQGNLSSLGNMLMRRFKSLETTLRDGSQAVASHQELLPPHAQGATSLKERELAAKYFTREETLKQSMRRPGG